MVYMRGPIIPYIDNPTFDLLMPVSTEHFVPEDSDKCNLYGTFDYRETQSTVYGSWFQIVEQTDVNGT